MIFNEKIQQKIQNLKNRLSTPQKITIIMHHNPDGDTIGGALALFLFLKKLNHNVNIISPGTFPDFFKWMPNSKNIIIFARQKKQAIDIIENSDYLFLIDFNDFARTEEMCNHLITAKAFKIMIDHHPDPTAETDICISDTTVSAASELVYLFMKEFNNNMIDNNIAQCIYTGIMTDTGNFSFNSSKPQTFRLVADLLEYEIDKDTIHNEIYNKYSENRMKLLGHCLNSKMVVLPEFKTAYMYISKADRDAFNFQQGDSEGFVNYPLSITDIVFSVLFIENDDHIKLSLRSKGNFSVNKIAQKYYHGGGHENASGGKSFKTLQETISEFETLLNEYKDEL